MIGKKRTRTKNKKTESFLSKLFDILSDANYNKIISWDNSGNKIVIFDVVKLCNEILPKFYKHRKYSSFIRQLNLYGFRKSKGIVDNLEKYEHDKFNKNITKEQIKQITNSARHNNMIKNIDTFINSTKCDETIDSVPDDKVINYLTKKIDENSKNILEIQKEMEKLKNEIKELNKELIEYKSNLNSNKILISKLIKNSVNTNIKNNKKVNKINNLKDLFNGYLYHLKIYSPFVNYDSVKLINQKEKNEIKTNANDNNNFPKFNRFNNDLNNSRDIDDNLSFLNEASNIQFIDLNLMNINYSNSFINTIFEN